MKDLFKSLKFVFLLFVGFSVLIIGLGYFISEDTNSSAPTELQALKTRRHEQLAEELRTNRTNIIAEIRRLIAQQEFSLALGHASRFSDFNDPELQALAQDARTKYITQREKELLALLKKLPTSDLDSKLAHYQELASLFPDNQEYKSKQQELSANLSIKKKQEQDEQQQRLTLFGNPPDQGRPGSPYWQVSYYLKQVANDPDSIDVDYCTQVYHVDTGWLVGCQYRGRNAFNALVRQANWFIIRQDAVVQMKEASAYNW